MNDSLIIRDDLSITFAPKADEIKAAALERSALVNRVRNAGENAQAVEAQVEIERVIHLVESSRKTVKQPIIDLGRRIDSTAAEYRAELEAEKLRLSQLVGDYATLELARLKSEEASRIAALTELERKRESELANATTHDERDEIQERYSDIAAVSVPATKSQDRASGQVVREEWEIEIVNDWELAKNHPNCVTIKPKLTEIKMMLDNGLKVSGVRATKKVKAGVRIGKEKEAIAV